MNRSDRKHLLLILFSVLLVAVGFEHGVWIAIAVGIFFGKIYVLSTWFGRRSVSLLFLYIALFVALTAITHVYVSLLSLSFFLIPWAVIKGMSSFK